MVLTRTCDRCGYEDHTREEAKANVRETVLRRRTRPENWMGADLCGDCYEHVITVLTTPVLGKAASKKVNAKKEG